MYIRIYIFSLKKKQKIKKAKETKEEKRISVKNLTGYENKRKKIKECKNKRKSLREIFIYHFLFYVYLFVAAKLSQ